MRTAGKFYKKYRKKILVTVIAAFLLCSLSSCGQLKGFGNGEEGGTENGAGSGYADSGNNDFLPDEKEPWEWHARHIALEERYAQAVLSEEMLYACRYEGQQVVIDCLKKEPGENIGFSPKRRIEIPGVSYLLLMECDDQGGIVLCGYDEKNTVSLWTADAAGSIRKTAGFTADFAEKEEEDITSMMPRGIFRDGQGYLYIWCQVSVPAENFSYDMNRVYVFDEEMNALFYEEAYSQCVLSFYADRTTPPAFLLMDEKGIYTQEIDTVAQELGNSAYLEGTEVFRAPHFVVPQETGFLFFEGYPQTGYGNELKEFNVAGQGMETVADLSLFGIFADDILHLRRSGDIIEIIDNPGEEQNSEYTVLEKGPASDSENVTVLTLGLTGSYDATGLDEMVTAFNRSRSDIRVEIVSYYDNDCDPAAGLEGLLNGGREGALQLKLDLVSGKGPDMIAGTQELYDILAGMGALADLYGLMREDEELNREMLVSSAAEAYETEGKLYLLSPAFRINTMWGGRPAAGKSGGVTLAELKRILKENGRSANAVEGLQDPLYSALDHLCFFGMDDLIDWEEGTCDFEGEYFKGLLEFAGEYREKDADTGEEALFTAGVIDSVADHQLETVRYGGELNYVGYPAEGGSGTAAGFTDPVAINALGADVQAAWEFVKFYILHGYGDEGFPMVKEQFEEVMERAMTNDSFVDVDGSRKILPKARYGDILIYAATEEDVSAVRRLVDNIGRRYVYNPYIMRIVDEEAEYYFQGQKTADETAEIIQSRLSLWLQEQM